MIHDTPETANKARVNVSAKRLSVATVIAQNVPTAFTITPSVSHVIALATAPCKTDEARVLHQLQEHFHPF